MSDHQPANKTEAMKQIVTLATTHNITGGWHRCLKHLCWRDEIKAFKINAFPDKQAA